MAHNIIHIIICVILLPTHSHAHHFTTSQTSIYLLNYEKQSPFKHPHLEQNRFKSCRLNVCVFVFFVIYVLASQISISHHPFHLHKFAQCLIVLGHYVVYGFCSKGAKIQFSISQNSKNNNNISSSSWNQHQQSHLHNNNHVIYLFINVYSL